MQTRPRWLSISLPALLLALSLTACLRIQVHGDPKAWTEHVAETMKMTPTIRVATYNTSLYDDADGGLVRRLAAGDQHARKIAAVLQRVRPDVVLLNEFDYDAQGRAADLFQRDYLERGQTGGGEALHYAYRYLAPVNTGVSSGLDLDRNGSAGGSGRERGNDAWGYGLHPGQYGMLVLSRHPIDAAAVRSFQQLKWSALPGARQPRDPATGEAWYGPEVWPQLRLSSKSHWDVPVRTPFGTVHLLAAHPTPPVFDGVENRNGARNFDEIRLWSEYLSAGASAPATAPWLCDDQGRCGGLAADARFVIAGDYNADPHDGEGLPGAIAQLLDHPRVDATHVPRSVGAVERAADRDLPRRGDVATHTGDFGPKGGTLRLDYVLPSRGLQVRGSGVFWPASGDADAAIGDASDHHLVWLDISAPTH
ncbi:endonuclease/exonuclease/phosphatase family protein [Montanilutibacter psychrotolerans]|uniref:Endonuclease/exonuclease/phosphatase family protein n=1 Tax=Montanilutibacter psychrotolerans TaxID=1327343 RepID=A0A3M8SSB8_9GAMM|nr:endonuclease/exonuclease/phosphatase family protein [Lysobacter psychrotolerans]RNF81730.1 endonuclease/exonuclease/phosphatase family protein [Lysobacter psychrotolerans]